MDVARLMLLCVFIPLGSLSFFAFVVFGSSRDPTDPRHGQVHTRPLEQDNDFAISLHFIPLMKLCPNLWFYEFALVINFDA